jgi:DNA repair protein RadD
VIKPLRIVILEKFAILILKMKTDFKLREYQSDALNKIDADLAASDKPVLLQAIMGAGKTVIICCLINKYFFESNRKFLILAHKQELVNQFYRTFIEKTAIPAHEIGISCAGLNSKNIRKRVTIATIQTFITQSESFGFVNLLVIDEAHRIEIGKNSQYDTVINTLRNHNANLRIIGLTATPYQLGHGYIYGDKCAGTNLFPALNYQIKYSELVESGYLMKLEGEIAVNSDYSYDISTVSDAHDGDFNLSQLGDMMSRQIHLDTAKQAIEEKCQDFKHICVFCCTIDHAEKLKLLIGDNCTIIHSKLTPLEREANMQAWLSGKSRIITSVNILVEGVDIPSLDCLVMARSTKSTALYLQAIGRVLRIAHGKTRAFLLDLTDNTERFGTDLDNVKIVIPKPVQVVIDKERAFEKQCPECKSFIHAACYECPECHYLFEREFQEARALPDFKSVVFEPPEPVEYHVNRIQFSRHQKEGKPDSVKISYFDDELLRPYIASDWLCFDHGGYARKFAIQKWQKICSHPSIPDSTETALQILGDYLIQPPVKIIVQQNGKYNKITDVIALVPQIASHVNDKPIIIDNDIDDIPF